MAITSHIEWKSFVQLHSCFAPLARRLAKPKRAIPLKGALENVSCLKCSGINKTPILPRIRLYREAQNGALQVWWTVAQTFSHPGYLLIWYGMRSRLWSKHGWVLLMAVFELITNPRPAKYVGFVTFFLQVMLFNENYSEISTGKISAWLCLSRTWRNAN